MKKPIYFLLIFFLHTGCGPRNVDWKEEWAENRFQLEKLTNDILEKGDRKYHQGNNHFPKGFE